MAGWAGSVVWRQLAPRLRKAGHEVYAPTLSVGSRFDEQTLIKALGNGRDAPIPAILSIALEPLC